MKRFAMYLVTALLSVGLAGPASAYFEDFDAHANGTSAFTLAGWSNPFSGTGTVEVSTDQSVSGANSLKLIDATAATHAFVDLADAAILGGAFSGTGVLVMEFDYYYQSSGGAMFGIALGSAGTLSDVNQLARVAPYEPNMADADGWFGPNGDGLPSTPSDTWVHVKIILDADNETVQYDFDGNVTNPARTWGAASPGESTTATDVGYLDLRPISGDGASYVDNLSISIVPEPSVMMLLAGGGLLAFARRRRRA